MELKLCGAAVVFFSKKKGMTLSVGFTSCLQKGRQVSDFLCIIWVFYHVCMLASVQERVNLSHTQSICQRSSSCGVDDKYSSLIIKLIAFMSG
jgi:hypothetical protein